jgi:hypothetical protein
MGKPKAARFARASLTARSQRGCGRRENSPRGYPPTDFRTNYGFRSRRGGVGTPGPADRICPGAPASKRNSPIRGSWSRSPSSPPNEASRLIDSGRRRASIILVIGSRSTLLVGRFGSRTVSSYFECAIKEISGLAHHARNRDEAPMLACMGLSSPQELRAENDDWCPVERKKSRQQHCPTLSA